MEDPDLTYDNCVSLRFKYGPQTIFLFVNWGATLAEISEQLLNALRERYPQGLVKSLGLPDTVPVPKTGELYRVAYALPRNPRDLAAGWKPVDPDGPNTPTSLRLRDNSVMAFVIQQGDDDAELSASDFHVEIPRFEDEE